MVGYNYKIKKRFCGAAMKKIAQGRYGEGIATSDLENIYEWTYKLQMLEQEERLGDYGVPQLLPDKAYMEKAKIESQLEQKLNKVHDRMVEVYDDWIQDHEPVPSYFHEQAREYWRSKRYEVQNGYNHIGDIADLFDDSAVLGTIVEYLQEIMEEKNKKETAYDEWINYLDSLKAKKAQQRQFEFMDEDEVELQEPQKPLNEMTIEEIAELDLVKENLDTILDLIEEETYFDEYMDQQTEFEREEFEDSLDSSFANVKRMQYALTEWDNLNTSDKIILFQEALTTMHNNGEMAEYLLNDTDAVDILTTLSEGHEVPEWDYELTKVLGYPLGSRSRPQTPEWFVPAALRHIAAAIDILSTPQESSMFTAIKRISLVVSLISTPKL